jgi:hypothetical protein
MFVAFSCKQRCTCPSCHQKRTLLTALHLAKEVCSPVAHRQVVLTIPKRLRIHTRFDRQLLGKLSSCAWTCLKAEAQRLLGRKFSLSRLVKVSDTGQVVYQAEKQACRAFPDPKGDGTRAGVKRNFQLLSPLDFLAEFTQHRPSLRSGARPKGSHLIRYYGWYSNKSRGMRKKAEAVASDESSSEEAAATGSSPSWAMLIKRVYEVDPLCCPECGGQMQVVSFIEPPQAVVIEEILSGHQSGAMVGGLWQSRSPRAPPDADELVLELDAAYSGNSIHQLKPTSPRS